MPQCSRSMPLYHVNADIKHSWFQLQAPICQTVPPLPSRFTVMLVYSIGQEAIEIIKHLQIPFEKVLCDNNNSNHHLESLTGIFNIQKTSCWLTDACGV